MFAYDGWYTLFDGNDLQYLDVKTGTITEVASGCCIAFAFSSDMRRLVFAQNAKITVQDLTLDLQRTTDIQSSGFEQAGPIFWSPTGNKLALYVMVDDTGNTEMIYLDVEKMEQKTLLEFDIEEHPFDGWTQNENPRYKLDGTLVVVDVRTGAESILETLTPPP